MMEALKILGITLSIVILSFVAVGITQTLLFKKTEIIKSGIFHHRYGGAICGEFIETACGITLKKCVDEVEYYCLHDVSANFDKKQ